MLPESLQEFDSLASTLESELSEARQLAATYRAKQIAGKILPNTSHAIRLELTYNSNAIEGNTLTLRETQLVLEGRSPGPDKDLREIYEARNHDRALQEIDRWLLEPADLSHPRLLQLHAIILADVDAREAGRDRVDRVRISGTGFIPPGSQKLDPLIATLL